MSELVPIVCGLAAGGLLALLSRKVRLVAGAAIAVVVGTIATVVSGEYQVSWEFLLIDIPLVALCSVIGLVVVRAWQRHLAVRDDGPSGTA